MHSDDDLLPISALQHLVFCARQCMLIHGEAVWSENRQTAEGRVLHDRVHEEASGLQEGKLVARGLRLSSARLGLSGIADVVEFLPVSAGSEGIELAGRPGRWLPFPVEYKRGRPKGHNADAVQLCAQALCLEEMLGVRIPRGALFYGKTRRRQEILFDASLRETVARLAERLHGLVDAGITPPPEPGPKCKLCSLRQACLPDLPVSARNYIRRSVEQILSES